MIVLWRVSTRCNYACGFCAYDRRLPIARGAADMEEVLRFGRLLGEWSKARARPVLLSWLGGEPLLWPSVWDVSAALAGEGLAISATTNGSMLHRPEARTAILAHFAELTVSIDGPAPVHDRLRGRAGAWEAVREGVRALVAARGTAALKLRANIVLMRETIEHFAALCATLADWGMQEITFNQLGGRDRPEFFPAQRLRPVDVARLESLLPALRERLAARGVTLCGDARYLERLRASAAGDALAVEDCRPGSDFLFIDEHGVAAPCSFSGAAYGVPLAALRTIGDLDALPMRFAAARAARRLATCTDCPSTQNFAKFCA
nr:radical SAM protein [uncultured Sphingomonas sp.]